MLNHFSLVKQLKQNFTLWDSFTLFQGLVSNKDVLTIPSSSRKVYLRKNTKDKETFLEVFEGRIYDTKLSFTPKTMVDAGANVGFSTLFFKLKYPEIEVVTLEIDDDNCKSIKKNLENYNHVDIRSEALFSRKSFFKIEDPYNATNSFVIKEVSENEDYTIQSTTIDEILKQKNWATLDILKIDIEGSEKDLFTENYENWLPKVKVLYVETHDRMYKGCSKAVTEALNKFDQFILYTTTEGTLVYYNTALMEIP